MSNNYSRKIIVPLDNLDHYMTSSVYVCLKDSIESTISNVGKKSNYKKFVKRLKKAVKYLPSGLEVVVRAGRHG